MEQERWWSDLQTAERSTVLSVRGGSLTSADEWPVMGALEMCGAGAIVVGSELRWAQ